MISDYTVRQLKLVLPVLLLLALTAGCGDKRPVLNKGQQPPAFTLERLDDGLLRFPEDSRGKVVAIRFWADWCPFCKSEMRDIQPVYRRYRDQGLVILAVNVRQDRATAERFINKLGICYDILLDLDGSVARAYGVSGLPTTFIVDRTGRLHTKIIGESTAELFEQLVRELL